MLLAKNGTTCFFLDLLFLDAIKWSGGKARSMQLYEIFEKAGFSFSEVEEPVRPGSLKIAWWALKGILQFGIYKPFCGESLRTTGFNYFRVSYFVGKYPNIATYLIEGTGFGTLQIVSFLKSFHKKVVLAPANVEALAPYPGTWTHSVPILDRLKEEERYYLLADAVFCISEEEDWLLNILGAHSFFLPYYPPDMMMAKINSRVQLRRLCDKPGNALYFANFNNSPNFLGFKDFIAKELYKNKKIKLAGIGVEKLLPLIQGKVEFDILGELSDEALENELVTCSTVILNHYPTSGMLTRVPELLLSEIPVTGNIAALKSYTLASQDDNVSLHLKQLDQDLSPKLLRIVNDLSAPSHS